MEVPNTSTNNANGLSSVDVPVPTTQKIRITIAPNAGGFTISVVPRDSAAEVVHGHGGHGHRGGPHCRRGRGMFPHPRMMGLCHQRPNFPAPMHGGPHHGPHFPHDSSPYAAELAQLKSEGFHCLWWIQQLLVMTNGNVEEVRQILNRKKNKKEAARQKWASELSQLHQIGFERDWVNLRLLKKYDGDMEKTLNKLMDYQNHIHKASCRTSEADLLKYKTQLEQLHEAGHHRDRFLIYWLDRFGGNVDAVLAKLQKKQTRREAKMAKFAPQLEQLRQAGHVNDRCNARLLKAADGDIEKVLRVLNSPKSGCPMRRGGWRWGFGAGPAESSVPADSESDSNSTPVTSETQEGPEDFHFGGFHHHHGHGHEHGPYQIHNHGPNNHYRGHHHRGHHGPHFGAHSGFGFPHHGMPHCPPMMSSPHHGPFAGVPGCPFGGPSPFAHRGPQPNMFPRGDDHFRC